MKKMMNLMLVGTIAMGAMAVIPVQTDAAGVDCVRLEKRVTTAENEYYAGEKALGDMYIRQAISLTPEKYEAGIASTKTRVANSEKKLVSAVHEYDKSRNGVSEESPLEGVERNTIDYLDELVENFGVKGMMERIKTSHESILDWFKGTVIPVIEGGENGIEDVFNGDVPVDLEDEPFSTEPEPKEPFVY